MIEENNFEEQFSFDMLGHKSVDTLHTHGYSLLLGDSYELIKTIPDKSIDLVIIDPPYLLQTVGAGFFGEKDYNSVRSVMKDIDFMKNGIDNFILDEICRVMKKINIYIWCSQKQLLDFIQYFTLKKKCNWNLICWHKKHPIPACRK